MPVPFENMKDIVYCHDEKMADEIYLFLLEKGYQVGMSSSCINTGTHGEQNVKRIDVFAKKSN